MHSGRRREDPGSATRSAALAAVLLLGCALLTGCGERGLPRPGGGIVAGLERLDLPRSLAPRLSVQHDHRPCAVAHRADATIPDARCAAGSGTPASERVYALASRAAGAIHDEADPDALHGAALIDLVWADGGGIPVERSISYLESAVGRAERPAPILADLAAAFLLRAGSTQSVRDLMEAIESATRALEMEPRNAVASFNLALGLDWLGLDDEARRAWEAYLRVDPSSPWAAEAEARAAKLAAALPPPPARGAGPAAIAAFVARVPQEAQLLGWDELLGEWGEAMLAGAPGRAAEPLGIAEALGLELARRGGDATLADQVAAIRARSGDPAGTRRLAALHRDYAAARAAYRLGEYSAADTLFARVLAGADRALPLHRWATVFHGGTTMYVRGPAQGEPLLRAAVAAADSVRYPALAGRARWLLGTTLLRQSQYEKAWTEYGAAGRALRRAGERENLGAVLNNSAVAERRLGLEAAADQSLHRALLELRPYRGSTWLHISLYAGVQAATDGDFPATARHFLDEDAAVAARNGAPVYVAESRLTRARFLAIAGERENALADLDAGREAAARLEEGVAREWFETDAREVEAIVLHDQPAKALALLDPVVGFWEKEGVPLRLLAPLLARADARLALGGVADAEADLERAIDLLDGQRAQIATATWRATLLESARTTFDRMVMLRLGRGDPGAALRYLERGRASFAPTGRGPAARQAGSLRAPPGQVAVEYALIGDTLLAWTLADTVVRLTRTTVDRAALGEVVERTRSSLELRAGERATAADLALLYDRLVRPIEARLGAPGTPLVLIGDGEVAGVPFAALYDSRRGRYLVQDHPLRFAPSLADASRAAPALPAERSMVIIEASGPAGGAAVSALPGARGEAAALRAQSPGAAVVASASGGREAVTDAMRRATVLHYAGHAVFDDARPDRSHLVLGGAEDPGSARLTADEIQRMQLGQLRLVVLAACETLRARDVPGGGFAGLSAAFLAAGAGGVVGTLWQVDDRSTRSLMVDFHRAYRESGDAAEALRTAQLGMLGSEDPALRSPAAWAGFRYAGN